MAASGKECSAILKSGKRRGQVCLSTARYRSKQGEPVCGRHRDNKQSLGDKIKPIQCHHLFPEGHTKAGQRCKSYGKYEGYCFNHKKKIGNCAFEDCTNPGRVTVKGEWFCQDHQRTVVKVYQDPPPELDYLLLKEGVYGYIDQTGTFQRVSLVRGMYHLHPGNLIFLSDDKLSNYLGKTAHINLDRFNHTVDQVGNLVYYCTYHRLDVCDDNFRINVIIFDINSMIVVDRHQFEIELDSYRHRATHLWLAKEGRVTIIDLTKFSRTSLGGATSKLVLKGVSILLLKDGGWTMIQPPQLNTTARMIKYSTDGRVVIMYTKTQSIRFNKCYYHLFVNGEEVARSRSFFNIYHDGCYVTAGDQIWFPHLPGKGPQTVPPGHRPVFVKVCRACQTQFSLQVRCAEIIKIKKINCSVIPKIIRERFSLK